IAGADVDDVLIADEVCRCRIDIELSRRRLDVDGVGGAVGSSVEKQIGGRTGEGVMYLVVVGAAAAGQIDRADSAEGYCAGWISLNAARINDVIPGLGVGSIIHFQSVVSTRAVHGRRDACGQVLETDLVVTGAVDDKLLESLRVDCKVAIAAAGKG